jgi:hypothetical protein
MKNPKMTLIAGILGGTLLSALMLGCDSGNSTGQGRLTLSITDAPVDGADHVYVVFNGIEIKAGSETIDITYAEPKRIDLLALTGGEVDTILKDQLLPAGQVQWMRLKVTATEGGDPTADSHIVINGTPHELTIPSGAQNGLKINTTFTVPEDGVANFTIDFDLRKSVHQDNTGYKLRPTLRLVKDETKGEIKGSFEASLCGESINTAAVYVYAGSDITANDINNNAAVDAVQPVTTANVTVVDPLADVASYQYIAAFLPAGDYTVAYTCTANLDDPETDDEIIFSGAANVTVVANEITTKNFVPAM